MTRKSFSDDLDKGAASPVGDHAEFEAAFQAVQIAYPDVTLTYVGTDGREHYFQEWGNPTAYVVPVSPGWSLSLDR